VFLFGPFQLSVMLLELVLPTPPVLIAVILPPPPQDWMVIKRQIKITLQARFISILLGLKITSNIAHI
jgi:hypothetical protein